MVFDERGVKPRGRRGRAAGAEERYGCGLFGAREPEYLDGGEPGAECMVVDEDEREFAPLLAAGEVWCEDGSDESEESLSVGEAASHTISSLSLASGERDPASRS